MDKAIEVLPKLDVRAHIASAVEGGDKEKPEAGDETVRRYQERLRRLIAIVKPCRSHVQILARQSEYRTIIEGLTAGDVAQIRDAMSSFFPRYPRPDQGERDEVAAAIPLLGPVVVRLLILGAARRSVLTLRKAFSQPPTDELWGLAIADATYRADWWIQVADELASRCPGYLEVEPALRDLLQAEVEPEQAQEAP